MVWFCRRAPHRAVGTAYGTPDMTSTPPATMTSARPALIIAMPETTASMAETQTRSMDTAVAVTGMPASMAAERATLLVRYGSKQLPRRTSSTAAGSTPARAMASRITVAASRYGGTSLRAPPKAPMAERQAAAMTTSSIRCSLGTGGRRTRAPSSRRARAPRGVPA